MKNHAVNVKIFSLFIFDGTDLMHCFIMFPVLFKKKSISVYIETANDSNFAALKLAYRVRGHTRSFVKRVSEWTKRDKVIKNHTLHI